MNEPGGIGSDAYYCRKVFMRKCEKVMETILRGTSDAKLAFDDIRAMLLYLGLMNEYAVVITCIEEKGLRKRQTFRDRGTRPNPIRYGRFVRYY